MMTIQCTRCATQFALPARLLDRVQGKVGRIPCRGCREKIRIDARGKDLLLLGAWQVHKLELELEDVPSARDSQFSLIPPALLDEPPEEIEDVESVRGIRSPVAFRAEALRPPPPSRLPPSMHAALRPPRPSIDRRQSLPPLLPSDPFDELGSLAPVVPLQGVRLTFDGRLVNRADEAPPPPAKPRSRMRTWAPLVAAALLATGLASAHAASILPLHLGRAKVAKVKLPPTLVVQPVSVSASTPAATPARTCRGGALDRAPSPAQEFGIVLGSGALTGHHFAGRRHFSRFCQRSEFGCARERADRRCRGRDAADGRA